MSLQYNVHPAQHLLGNHSCVLSPSLEGAGPAICLQEACHSSPFLTGDSPFLWALWALGVHREAGPWCPLPPQERDLKDKPEGARCPRCDHRRQLPGNAVETQRQTAGANSRSSCAQSLHPMNHPIRQANKFLCLPPYKKFFFATLHGMWDLSSQTRTARLLSPSVEGWSLNHCIARKVLIPLFNT